MCTYMHLYATYIYIYISWDTYIYPKCENTYTKEKDHKVMGNVMISRRWYYRWLWDIFWLFSSACKKHGFLFFIYEKYPEELFKDIKTWITKWESLLQCPEHVLHTGCDVDTYSEEPLPGCDSTPRWKGTALVVGLTLLWWDVGFQVNLAPELFL